LTRFWNS